MWRLVLLVPFFATLSRQEILEMASNLRLTVNRTDDWDSQIAFSLCGETGSVRLFRKSDEEAVKMAYNYEFYGTASNEEDAELVKRFFGPCRDAVISLNGKIDEDHVIAPPGRLIQLQGYWV